MSISVLNTDAGLSGKTLQNLEDNQTVTGLKTFDRDPNPPFAVTSGSAVVSNLDADKVDGLDAAAFLKVDGSSALTGGLQFPATQAASSNANTLDDYEEGTWTPIDSSGTGLSFTSAEGEYVKIGQLVIASATLTFPVTADGASAVIGGLPFTVRNSTNNLGVGAASHTGAIPIAAHTLKNTTTVGLFDDPGITAVTNAEMSTTIVKFTVAYRATA